ncbi:ribosome maturation factor RimP [Allocatelliglobosispora scoriae]|uniref:Ribosome maturation factor RimP n=1 Tax=Allocatelliglobosispora scoriae TaxID=643052 RepID=A0A841C058_9ACTN|nr:ribosome maturation factor RimP [Allocatelliglobosispora scoriae]MBB5872281.1 ribosome maturation factor RimP [Allocatelliglobosispora scoriae]
MAQGGRSVGRGRPSAPRRTDKGAPREAVAPIKAPAADLAAARDRVQALIEPVLTTAGYDLESLTLKQVGRRFSLKLTVDGDGGVNLDTIAELSRAVADTLDEAEAAGREIIAGEYQLEVSSPGVDRPLTLPRHWRRAIGRLVAVKAAEKQVTGRVVGTDESSVTFEINGAKKTFRLAELGAGRVQIEFSRLEEISDDDLEEIAGDEDDEDDEEQQ